MLDGTQKNKLAVRAKWFFEGFRNLAGQVGLTVIPSQPFFEFKHHDLSGTEVSLFHYSFGDRQAHQSRSWPVPITLIGECTLWNEEMKKEIMARISDLVDAYIKRASNPPPPIHYV